MSRKRQSTLSDFFAAVKAPRTVGVEVSPNGGAPKKLTQCAAGVPAEITVDSSDGENQNPTPVAAKASTETRQQEQRIADRAASAAASGGADGDAGIACAVAVKIAGIPQAAAAAPEGAASTQARQAARTGSAAAAAGPLAAIKSSTGGVVCPTGQFVSFDAAEKMWREAMGDSWYEALKEELALPYMQKCLQLVAAERRRSPGSIFPPEDLVFNAFRATPLEKVRVVIVGQDPYHQPGQAMGLCFSVARGVRPPPSLLNIFKEIDSSLPGSSSLPLPHGDLTSWASQGVFLLNAILTVRRDTPMAHKDFGWERFTDKVLSVVNSRLSGVIFLLWGKAAQKKSAGVSPSRHSLLKAGHPSPLAVRFFAGCGHFAKCNELLVKMGKEPIDFKLKP
ncbi:uncharacterized protein LOC34621696 [Cyclospora cayetanensis]|uniref:Uracil-DNA glycosylase n=1 Tax=Cyclospora cayetanensis TaxID=88456 RepID=A0A6P6S095_9EIME|nr:uncharacterized protein LOC34621696 [Cyclospora cayetanensis]